MSDPIHHPLSPLAQAVSSTYDTQFTLSTPETEAQSTPQANIHSSGHSPWIHTKHPPMCLADYECYSATNM